MAAYRYRYLSYSDPFGLCADSLKDGDGACPGGLTDKEWDQVEGAAKKMDSVARNRIMNALYAGNIRGANLPSNWSGNHEPLFGQGVIVINRSSAAGSVFEDPRELGFTLAHESQHVVQTVGMSFWERVKDQWHYNQDRTFHDAVEATADLFACNHSGVTFAECR